MERQNLTATLPAVRCTPEMRADVEAIAAAAHVDLADVVRDALKATMVHMKLSLQLVTLDDLEDEQLEELGIERPADTGKKNPTTGWGPDLG